MNTGTYKEIAKAAKTFAASEALRQEVYDEQARVFPNTRFDYKGRTVQVVRLAVVCGKHEAAPVEVWYTVAPLTAKGTPNTREHWTVTAEDFERHSSNVQLNVNL